jgi:hypothetical protein
LNEVLLEGSTTNKESVNILDIDELITIFGRDTASINNPYTDGLLIFLAK